MNCTEVRHDLEALLDNAVDEPGRHSIELHLASCHLCRSQLDHLRSLGRVLRENSAINVPASLDRRVISSFNARHAVRETGASGWRNVFLRSLRIPAPVFGLFLLTAVGAVAVSYWIGKQNATSIVVAAPPAPAQVENPIARGTPVDHQAGRHEPEQRQTTVVTFRRTAPKRIPLSDQAKPSPQPLRSSTTINASSATYSTVASLQGFEPLITATARIIKGGHDK
jgi:anti-sigma factor RsiW